MKIDDKVASLDRWVSGQKARNEDYTKRISELEKKVASSPKPAASPDNSAKLTELTAKLEALQKRVDEIIFPVEVPVTDPALLARLDDATNAAKTAVKLLLKMDTYLTARFPEWVNSPLRVFNPLTEEQLRLFIEEQAKPGDEATL